MDGVYICLLYVILYCQLISIEGRQGMVNIVSPQPVEIGLPMTVTCSVASIGGSSKVEGLQLTGIKKLQLSAKPGNEWKLLAFYEKIGNRNAYQGSAHYDLLPNLTRYDFARNGGNADEFFISMTVTTACHYVIPYRCSIFHITEQKILKVQHFEATPVGLEYGYHTPHLLMTVLPDADEYSKGKNVTLTCTLQNTDKEHSSDILWQAARCESPDDFHFKSVGLRSETRLVSSPTNCSFNLISEIKFPVSEKYCRMMCTVVSTVIDRSSKVKYFKFKPELEETKETETIIIIAVVAAVSLFVSVIGFFLCKRKSDQARLQTNATDIETSETETNVNLRNTETESNSKTDNSIATSSKNMSKITDDKASTSYSLRKMNGILKSVFSGASEGNDLGSFY